MSQQTDFLIQSLIGSEDNQTLQAAPQTSAPVETPSTTYADGDVVYTEPEAASLPQPPRPGSLSKFQPLLDNSSAHSCPQSTSSSAETLYTVTKLYLPPPTTTCNAHTNNETLPTLFNVPSTDTDIDNSTQTNTPSQVITPEAQFSTLAVFSNLQDSNNFLASISATNKSSIESSYEYTHNGCLVSQQTLPDGAVVSLKVEKVTSGAEVSSSVDGAADVGPLTLGGGDASQYETPMTKKEKADLDKKAKSDKKVADKAKAAAEKASKAEKKVAEKAKKSEKTKKDGEVTSPGVSAPVDDGKKVKKVESIKKVETIEKIEKVEKVDRANKSRKENSIDAPSHEKSSHIHQEEKFEKSKKAKKADRVEKKTEVDAPSRRSQEQSSHIHEEGKAGKLNKSKKTDKVKKDASIDLPSGHSHERSSHIHEDEKFEKVKKSKKAEKVKKDASVDDPSSQHTSVKKDKKAEEDKRIAENVKKAEEELKAEKAKKAGLAKKAAEKIEKAEQEKKAEEEKKAAEKTQRERKARKDLSTDIPSTEHSSHKEEQKSKKSDKSRKEPSVDDPSHHHENSSHSQDDKKDVKSNNFGEAKKDKKEDKPSGLSGLRARRESRKSEKAEKDGKKPLVGSSGQFECSSHIPDYKRFLKPKKGPFGKSIIGCCPHSHDKTRKFMKTKNPGDILGKVIKDTEKVKKEVLSHVPFLGCLNQSNDHHSHSAHEKKQKQRNAEFEERLRMSKFKLSKGSKKDCQGCEEEAPQRHDSLDQDCQDPVHNDVAEDSDEECGLCEEEQEEHDCEGCRREGKRA